MYVVCVCVVYTNMYTNNIHKTFIEFYRSVCLCPYPSWHPEKESTEVEKNGKHIIDARSTSEAPATIPFF